ncbi:BIG1-domain-containing protein [Stipitochalara longipes BDJ]|nr:BIG1-domain-containing protein [Stipitochalara longipes BDJ]
MKATLLALAALAATVQAFKDTSPFLIVSSSPLPKLDSSTGGLGLSAEVLQSTKSLLQPCTSELYLVVSQPSMSIHDIGFSPFLKSMVSARQAGNNGVVMREVLGFNGAEGMDLVRFLGSRCGASFAQTVEGKGKRVVLREFPALEGRGTEREGLVGDHDATLQKELSKIPQGTSYTLIYLSTSPPSSNPASPSTSTSIDKDITYEPSFENDAVHMDLKRNLAPPRGKGPFSDQRPLFEKYQFLTPGLFMGILVGLILLAILSVGISAISGLKVSYSAFEKEMGPAAHKKTQ